MNILQNKIWIFISIVTSLIVHLVNADNEELIDTRNGADMILKCRFNKQKSWNDFSYYWARSAGPNFENVAIGNVQLNTNYRLNFQPESGVYDLHIKNASYGRDNGRFECRVKAVGTGADVHQQYYNVTVLTLPGQPIVIPGAISIATEDKPQELSCSSMGGSPEPTIMWFREGNSVPLDGSTLINSGKKTTSTLRFTPRREDDGGKYRCVVWNRAMEDGHRLETIVTLSVNYYPRVAVGPQNPLQIEQDTAAKLVCNVDAKPTVTFVKWTRNGRFFSTSMTHTIHRVSIHDVGKYTCTADNGLGRYGEADINLDVLYSPLVVIESKTREVEEHERVKIRCNVTANPKPITVEWLKEGSPNFRSNGQILEIPSVRAEHAGRYLCRAINIMNPYGSKQVERIGNSTVALLVRHRPGLATINPSQPIVHVGLGVTLTCTANPPGWPVPQYRWFRDIEGEISSQPVLSQGSRYIIPRAHAGSEGNYHCHAVNELGNGDMATITLEVHQPPQFISKLMQHQTKRATDTNFSLTCSAKGKPKPSVSWHKDGKDITQDINLYEVITQPLDGAKGMVTVQSVLRFIGSNRPNRNELIPSDRGLFSCVYKNIVSSSNSSMELRIEHAPIVLHQYNKVAYDLQDVAEIHCKVKAYPRPEFTWTFSNNPSSLSMSSDGHYKINNSVSSNDVYTSVLFINNVMQQDYGDYLCRAVNPLETIRISIQLQPIGPPDKPENLKIAAIGSNYVNLQWTPGFNGGIGNTKYSVSYRKTVSSRDERMIADCMLNGIESTEWLTHECDRRISCRIQHLDQHQPYVFRVRAMNIKGASRYSNETVATTSVQKIPAPLHVRFNPLRRSLGVTVEATCLALIAIVESVIYMGTDKAWQIVDTIPIVGTGTGETHRDKIIEHLTTPHRSSALSLGIANDILSFENEEINNSVQVRVKLCLKANTENCGKYTDAEIGASYVAEASTITTPTLIAFIVSCSVVTLFAGLILIFCRCKRSKSKNTVPTKDHEMNSIRSSIVAEQDRTQLPYYPNTELENKSLGEHNNMDYALAIEEQQKSTTRSTSHEYTAYHPHMTNNQHMPSNNYTDGSVSYAELKVAIARNNLPTIQPPMYNSNSAHYFNN